MEHFSITCKIFPPFFISWDRYIFRNDHSCPVLLSTIFRSSFHNFVKPDQIADYGIASGIFNVRLGQNDADWSAHLQTTLDLLHETSHDGFAFNCLTSYSDKNKMRDYLYYANPCELFNYCKQRYSRQVALLHDYDLYEFTILVRKRS